MLSIGRARHPGPGVDVEHLSVELLTLVAGSLMAIWRWSLVVSTIHGELSNTRQGDFHIFVADVVKSFDTVDRDILDRALGRLGLPAWLRRVYFSFHGDVRLGF